MRVDSVTVDVALTKGDLTAYRQTGMDPVEVSADVASFLTEHLRSEGLIREPIEVASAEWRPVTWGDALDDTAAYVRLVVHGRDPFPFVIAPMDDAAADAPPASSEELRRRHEEAVAEGKPGVVYDTPSEGRAVGVVEVEQIENDAAGVYVTGTAAPFVHVDRYGQERPV